MRTTIDEAGRIVIPKPLREQLGIRRGEVEVTAEGTGVRIEPVADDELEERDGWLVVPPSGASLDDETVRALRHADQR